MHRFVRMAGFVIVLACVLLLLSSAVPAQAAPSVLGVSGTPAEAAPGETFGVQVRVEAGRRAHRATNLTVWLSKDRRGDAGDLRAGTAKVRALKARKARTLRAGVKVPTASGGAHYVLVCAAKKPSKRCASSPKAVAVRPANLIGSPLEGAAPVAGGPSPVAQPTPGPAAQPAPSPTAQPTPSPTAEPTPQPTPDPVVEPGPLAHEPNPRTVSPSHDASRAVKAVVDSAGGKIDATAADGSTFTLTVPAAALPLPTEITLTPMTSIAGLPYSGGLAAGVSLAPSGTRLLSPATLRIDPAATVATDRRSPFGYRGAGEHLHAFPAAQDGETTVFSIMHLTGYGVGDGSAADRADQLQHPPAAPEDQAMQDVAAVSSARRATATTEESMRIWWNADVFPTLMTQLSIGPTEQLLRAITSARMWLAAVERAGLQGQFVAEWELVFNRIPRIVVEGWMRARSACQGGDFLGARLMLQWDRIAFTLNHSPWQGIQIKFPSDVDTEAEVRKCLRFELEFDTTLTQERSTQKRLVQNRVLDLPITLHEELAGTPFGYSPKLASEPRELENVKWQIVDSSSAACKFTAYQSVSTGPFRVIDVDIPLDLREVVQPDGQMIFVFPPPTWAEVTIDIGSQENWYDYFCSGYGTLWTDHMRYVWGQFHDGDLAPPSPGNPYGHYRLQVPFVNGLHARREITDAIPPADQYDSTWNESTILDLEHKPELP
jgi:hypothetical protein